MPTRPHRFVALVGFALACAACGAAAPARGQMMPVDDLRLLSARAVLSGYGQHLNIPLPPPPFGAWEEFALAEVYGDKAGSASATAYQNSSFYEGGIFAAGTTSGQVQVYPGQYEAISLSTMTFDIGGCVQWFLDATLDPGEAGSEGEITVGYAVGPQLVEVSSGHVQLQGRLSPGRYFVEGRSSVTTNGPSMNGPTYSLFWNCLPCASALIQLHPVSAAVPLGGSASYSVVTAPEPAGVHPDAVTSFQWRRNGTALVDGGAYDGVHTPALEITGASLADTGWYDVVVTSGSIVEPSSIARLSILNTADVGPGAGASGLRFALGGATPNPSRGATSFRYAAAQPVRATATIHDAAGRRVRDLGTLALAGSGVIAWDGEGSGTPLAAGLYFLRVELPGESHVLRFVRLN